MSPSGAPRLALLRLCDLAALRCAALLGFPAPTCLERQAPKNITLVEPPGTSLRRLKKTTTKAKTDAVATLRHIHHSPDLLWIQRMTCRCKWQRIQPLWVTNVFFPLYSACIIYREDGRTTRRQWETLEKPPGNLHFSQPRRSLGLLKALSCDNHKGFLHPDGDGKLVTQT